MKVCINYSCGDASAVAAKIALKKYAGQHEMIVVRIRVPDEDADSDRHEPDYGPHSENPREPPACICKRRRDGRGSRYWTQRDNFAHQPKLTKTGTRIVRGSTSAVGLDSVGVTIST